MENNQNNNNQNNNQQNNNQQKTTDIINQYLGSINQIQEDLQNALKTVGSGNPQDATKSLTDLLNKQLETCSKFLSEDTVKSISGIFETITKGVEKTTNESDKKDEKKEENKDNKIVEY